MLKSMIRNQNRKDQIGTLEIMVSLLKNDNEKLTGALQLMHEENLKLREKVREYERRIGDIVHKKY